jgi:two-component system cell cycle response regulator
MVDARVIALVLGVVGLAFGVGSLAAGIPALGAVAGVAAIAAGGAALVAPSARSEAEPAAPDDRDQTIDRTRRELADARGEIEALRAELAAARADAQQRTEPTPELAGADTSALTDPESQLFSEAYFRVALQSRLAAARRHLRPVSVCLIHVAQGQGDDAAAPAPPARVADAIRETLREADIACRLDDGTFAVILEDTPENGAVWTVERTRRNLVSRSGPHTMWAGIACYPAHAFSAEELVDQARSALVAAKEWNQDRIEVAVVEG